MKTNPKALLVTVDNVDYFYTWQDFACFLRLNVFKDEIRIGYRDLPINTSNELNTLTYLIRQIVRQNEHSTRTNKTIKQTSQLVRAGRWLSYLRNMLIKY